MDASYKVVRAPRWRAAKARTRARLPQLEFFHAASGAKEILPYDAEHPLNEAAATDCNAWLRATLGLPGGTSAATPAV